MLPTKKVTKHFHILLPAIAIAIVYTAFFAIPQHRENFRVSATSQQHFDSVEKLHAMVKTQKQNAVQTELIGRSSDIATPKPTATHEVSLAKKQTFVQGFAKLLSIFQSHEVDCTGADPEKAGAGTKIDRTVTHRVSLEGSFGDVLASMEAIRKNIPHAVAAELSMKRPDPLGQCTWKIAFRFEEDK